MKNENVASFVENDIFDKKIKGIISGIESYYDFKEGTIGIKPNYSRKKKEHISKTIYIFEEEYPQRYRNAKMIGREIPIVTIPTIGKKDGTVDITIGKAIYENIDLPRNMVVSKRNPVRPRIGKSGRTVTIRLKVDDPTNFAFLEKCICYSIENYVLKDPFGCCSHFVECSDARRCVHPNKIYAMRCYYKRNLDLGKIFYGKNKTI